MNSKELESIFHQNGDILKTSTIFRNGITKYEVKKLTDTNVIERISKGYYKLVSEDISDAKLISIMIPQGIIYLDSALFYYGYSDRAPNEWHIAVDKDISKSKMRLDYPMIKAYYLEPGILEIGVEEMMIDDVEMRIYSRDRLICDCLKYETKMDIEIFNKALMNYIEDSKKNISKLFEYAAVRGVTKKVYDKIGTWL